MKMTSRFSLANANRHVPAKFFNGLAANVVVGAAMLFLPSAARSATFSVGSNIEFSNGQAPASATTPWEKMSISDNGPGSVIFTLTAPNLTGSENVSEFDFNIDPALSADLGKLSFTDLVKLGSFDTPTIGQGEDAFKADGDGKYDIQLLFTTGGNTSKTFTNGDSLQYTISGTGISASSFDFLSTPAGGHGPFVTAAHVQNTTGAGSGGSGWVADNTNGSISIVTVPEPSSVVLLALGFLGLVAWGRPRLRDISRRHSAF